MRVYGPSPIPAMRGPVLAAFRAVAASPGGLRREAHSTAMVVLVGDGLVEERPATFKGRREGETAWFLTPAGKRVKRALCRDDG